MENFEIVKIENRYYTLKNIKTGKTYRLAIKFFDYDQQIKVGTIIGLHSELLDPNYQEYSTEYYFGPIDEPYGRKVDGKDDINVIGIKIGNEKIYLKRFFG